MNQNSAIDAPHYRQGLGWPILLIGAGLILLLMNLGLLSANLWAVLGRSWPVILIVIGIDVLVGRRGMLGQIVSDRETRSVIAEGNGVP